MSRAPAINWLRRLGISDADVVSSVRRSRKPPKYNKHRFLKKITESEYPMPTPTNEYFLAASDLSDHIATKLMVERQKKNTLMEEITLLATKQGWVDFVHERFEGSEQYQIVHYSSHGMIVIDLQTNAWMSCSLNANATTVRIFGTRGEIDEFISITAKRFDIAESYVEWIYSPDGNSVNVPLRTDRTPMSEMYPFLGDENIEDFYDRYIESDASILLLIGPPGTGKTTFIRGLLQHTKSSAVVTYDAAILEKDYVFAQFIEGEANVMVMEDADTFLKARSEGNSMMHRFLNVGDGLVTTKGKKLIFSTNLPSIRDVDSALIRPGRCFDILNFELLEQDQAERVAKKAGVKIDQKDKWSIAEIFNGEVQTHDHKSVGRRVGFV